MTRRILVVDDEPDVVESLASLFAREAPEWEVVTSTSPQDALSKLDGVDLVLADHRMPGMTGVELLTQVRSRRPSAIRVLLTAYGDLEVALAALERAEVHYYLRKPWEAGEMHSLLASAQRNLAEAQAS